MAHYINPHQPNCPWHFLAEWSGAPNVKWCEQTLCQWISEPINTWSNVAYFIAAAIIFYQCRSETQKEVKWMGPAMFFMGLFSFIYHMTNSYLTQIFDFIGIFMSVYWMIVLNLRRLNLIKKKMYLPLMLSMSTISLGLIHIMYTNQIKFQIIVLIAGLTIGATEYLNYQKVNKSYSLKNFIIACIFIIVAQAASLVDGARVLCHPHHWMQGHAIWHILGAVGLYFAFMHFRQFDYSKEA